MPRSPGRATVKNHEDRLVRATHRDRAHRNARVHRPRRRPRDLADQAAAIWCSDHGGLVDLGDGLVGPRHEAMVCGERGGVSFSMNPTMGTEWTRDDLVALARAMQVVDADWVREHTYR